MEGVEVVGSAEVQDVPVARLTQQMLDAGRTASHVGAAASTQVLVVLPGRGDHPTLAYIMCLCPKSLEFGAG